MHFRVLLLTLFAIITTAFGVQLNDGTQFHILKTYWPVPPPPDVFMDPSTYTEYSWIVCPAYQFDCSCFWGGYRNDNILGDVGQPYFKVAGYLCNYGGQINFFLDTAGNYQFSDSVTGDHLGHCEAQNASVFTMGSGSQAISTSWTICNGEHSPTDVPNPVAEKTNLGIDQNTTPPNFMDSISCDQPSCGPVQTGNLANYDWVSDYMVCYSNSVCVGNWQWPD